MGGLIIWKNQQINRLRRDMDRLCSRLLEDFGMPLLPRTGIEVPYIDLSETETDLIIKAELPGVDPKDLDISLSEGLLTIKGEMKRDIIEEGENYHRTERQFGSFSRTFKLPCRVKPDDVEATYKKGILNIVMPKRKSDTREVRLQIK
jgi:HSP20 family protein